MPTRLACVLVLVWLPTQAAEYPTGPALDGAPGFGRSPTLKALEAIYRRPEPSDRRFLAGLRDTIVDVDGYLARTEARARRAGLMRLLPLGMDSLPVLLRHVQRIKGDPYAAGLDAEQALALVRCVSDWRLLAQASLIEARQEEGRELIQALDLLHGHTHGLVGLLPGEELALVTGRADLAAARLRAILADLRSLSQPLHQAPAPLSSDQLRAASGLFSRSGSSRRSYSKLVSAAAGRLARWSADSALTRFDRDAAGPLGIRRRGRFAGDLALISMYEYLPIFDSRRPLPESHAHLSAIERARLGVEEGTRALWLDPLNGQLNYSLALATDFASGPKAAEHLYDRFLVLAGIRYYDHRTFQYRTLDPFEEYALGRIAGWLPTGSPR